jgi:hypothetical protein
MYHDLGIGPYTGDASPVQTVPWNPNLPVPATTGTRINAPAALDAAGGVLRGVLDLLGSARRRTPAAPVVQTPPPAQSSTLGGVSPVVLIGGLALVALLLLRD